MYRLGLHSSCNKIDSHCMKSIQEHLTVETILQASEILICPTLLALKFNLTVANDTVLLRPKTT